MKASKLHHSLWNWLSKNPTQNKLDWPGWSHNGGRAPVMPYECFACHTTIIDEDKPVCDRCPCDWPGPSLFPDHRLRCFRSTYGFWAHGPGYLRYEMAMKIRDAWIGHDMEVDLEPR